MIGVLAGISVVAMTTILLELALTRVFDVILTPNLAYMVISCAMFSFGLAGIWGTLRPVTEGTDLRPHLARLSVLFGLSTVAMLPLLNALPFDYEDIPNRPILQLFAFAGMYLALAIPFFLSGLVFTRLFSAYAKMVQKIYFWDLCGAALGCVIILPLLPPIGAGGLVIFCGAGGLIAAACFATSKFWRSAAILVAIGIIAIPAMRSPDYYEATPHLSKRGVRVAKAQDNVEFSRWDPVSKIDVIPQELPLGTEGEKYNRRKHVAYDGGNQSSHIYYFDGNIEALREGIDDGSIEVREHFWHRGVLASHYLKRDRGTEALIIGSAAGQETKAALMYGAKKIDAVEMVGVVVKLGKERYAKYNGGIFIDPRVTAHIAEGRSFLRSSERKFDIIQIHSNHTSSSIAAGTGAMAPTFLQTADAYREYFSHLRDDGILHINHHIYPRMVTTAALAWKQMGREDFQSHVIVFSKLDAADTLPTMLIKMTPWTKPELEEMKTFFAGAVAGEYVSTLMQDPFDTEKSFLPPEFFSGEYPQHLADLTLYHSAPSTDERPFFNFLRKDMGPIDVDLKRYTTGPIAAILNSQLRMDVIAMDVVHLLVTGVISVFFAVLFAIIPLKFSSMGRAKWRNKHLSMVYFSCLGAGFIIFELVFIQLFMKLVGFPVHTYATVIFTMLMAAGLGSLSSDKLGISPSRRWTWPFIGTLVYGSILALGHGVVFDYFLAGSDAVRVIVAGVLIFPLGFVLGVPFPLGVLALRHEPRGAVAWAWGLNGLFTVIGGLASVVLAIFFGFTPALFVAIGLYAIAFWAYSKLRLSAVEA